MENLEQILKHWEKDSIIDQTEPGKELIRIPILHSKYIKILVEHKMASKKAHFDYLRLKKVKWEYFNGLRRCSRFRVGQCLLVRRRLHFFICFSKWFGRQFSAIGFKPK